ncbi:MAG TPA: RNA-binding S4 domain-containing protein [Parvularculaceae bacterium]|nr:RNA-binding S4 domain-containing protein [Parvularculaceae bacterium]HNS87996.1 RNA-binding S4 domain-containing protein [Parvularculaceae bacterium]
MSGSDDEPLSRRIDRWLWCARAFKTRSIAAKFVSEASVRVTRDGATQRVDKPSFLLRVGDEVSFVLGERVIVMTVAGFAARRGPPAVARALFAPQANSQDRQPAPAGDACKAAR